MLARNILLWSAASLLASAALAPPALADPFQQGKMRGGVGLGASGGVGNVTVAASAGLGYFIVDNVELGLDGTAWLLSDPFMAQFGPQVRYVMSTQGQWKPYAGVFGRRWFFSGVRDDVDTVGFRIGAFRVGGGGPFMNVGLAHERTVSACTQDCSDTYPEVGVSMSF